MFEIRNLRYKDILYIEKMNIRKGITTSITGRSGSGKTTLLKMLNKMISPDEGTILYEKKRSNLLMRKSLLSCLTVGF